MERFGFGSVGKRVCHLSACSKAIFPFGSVIVHCTQKQRWSRLRGKASSLFLTATAKTHYCNSQNHIFSAFNTETAHRRVTQQ